MPPYEYQLPKRQLVSQNDAAMIEQANVPRSRFTGSWTRKSTFDVGYLVPFMVNEILPGDHMSYDVTAMIRLNTPLFPIFDNLRVDTFFFFVPCRIVWDNWVKFMGEQASPSDSIAYTIPVVASPVAGFAMNSLFDHFGIPGVGQIAAGESIDVNALPLRAYNLIYNTWFRDQNITNGITVNKGDGPDNVGDYGLRRRAKSHDYFTSALPWPQKFTAPLTPLSGTAPVMGIGFEQGFSGTHNVTANQTLPLPGGQAWTNAVRGTDATTLVVRSNPTGADTPYVFADLSLAAGVSINVFRQAWMVQTLLERDARGGTRYVELIRSHFGVTNPDFRLQRPEYIGGGQTPLVLTPIAQTAPTTGVPLGALGAAGTAAGQHRASYAATEHGYIIGLINVRSELSYQQGLHKMWQRQTRYDFYWPALASLGEQAILRSEIYINGNAGNDATVFGYQERWHEYRTQYSDVAGMFRSTTASAIDQWHLAQKFTAAPALTTGFIEDIPDMARVLAAGSAAANMQLLADILIHRNAVRPIPTYGTPAILGRF